MSLPRIDTAEILDRFTLIVGEVNRGKTHLTQCLLEGYCADHGGAVTVVDLAPRVPERAAAAGPAGGAVGGALKPVESPLVRYLRPRLHAPRLQGRSEADTSALAEQNARVIEAVFEAVLEEKAPALFVNDCSLYLHAGTPERMLGWIRSAATAVVNGYKGRSLGEGALSMREREGMEFLMRHCDRLIRL